VLGIFQGRASQCIGNNGSYQNNLQVSPNDWLTATLDGVWQDWDGELLLSPSRPSSSEDSTRTISDHDNPQDSKMTMDTSTVVDWGARHWKVTFVQLQIQLLGQTVFRQQFDSSTSRVWRTTYLLDDTRIVRAGKTGRREDEVVFYTKRIPAPMPLYKY
jgi:hypothetical protein